MVSRKRALQAAENRDRQEVYRKKHREDLRKARRVATALMALRSHEGCDSEEFHWMKTLLERLEGFFVGDEMQVFISIAKLTPAQRQAKADQMEAKVEAELKAFTERLRKVVR